MKRAVLALLLIPAAWSLAWHPWGWAFAIGVHPYPGPSTPWTYQLYSGFLPALTVLTLLTSALGYYRGVNCHVHRCWRIGRYPVAGGTYKVCAPHHPDDEVRRGKVTMAHVHLAHRRHQGSAP